jgi:hypothetical protein
MPSCPRVNAVLERTPSRPVIVLKVYRVMLARDPATAAGATAVRRLLLPCCPRVTTNSHRFVGRPFR